MNFSFCEKETFTKRKTNTRLLRRTWLLPNMHPTTQRICARLATRSFLQRQILRLPLPRRKMLTLHLAFCRGMSTRKGGYILTEMDIYELAARLRDHANGIAEACDAFIQKESKNRDNLSPSDIVDWDVAKVNWTEQKMEGKPQTWFADAEANKDNEDFKRMWKAMQLAKEAKGNLEPFYFWLKGMPRQFMWFNQSGTGVYRRLKK